MKRPVTIVRPSPQDRFGDPTGPDAEFRDTCLWVIGLPSSSDDTDGQHNRVASRVTAYPLGETRVRAEDRVKVDGVTWLVDGQPARAESPFTGRLAGYQVSLKRFEG